MDLDLAFVTALVLSGDSDSFKKLLYRGVVPEFVRNEQAQKAFRFVQEYHQEYKSVPTPEMIAGKTGVTLLKSSEGEFGFYVDEILNRELHIQLTSIVRGIAAKLDARAPNDAHAAFLEGVGELRSMGLGLARTESLMAFGEGFLEYYDLIKSGHRGILTPWHSINESTLGFWPEDFVLFVARQGIGKCLRGDTELVDPVTGLVHTIEEIFHSDEVTQALTWSKADGVHAAPITAKVDTGTKDCLKFVTATGREIIVTPEHPFLTPDGWKRADELMVGGSLAAPAKTPFPTEPQALEDTRIDLLALVLAGAITGVSGLGKPVVLTRRDGVLVGLAEAALESVGCVIARQTVASNPLIVGAEGESAAEVLQEHGISWPSPQEMRVPPEVFRLDKASLSRFLSVFWMCADDITNRGIGAFVPSEKVARQLQSLMLRLGIQSRVRDSGPAVDGSALWSLRVIPAGYIAFRENVAMWGAKKETAYRVTRSLKNKSSGTPVASPALRHRIAEVVRTRRMKNKRRVREPSPRTDMFYGTDGGWHRSKALIFLNAYPEAREEFGWIWDSGLFWDHVVSIEPAGPSRIFDLTMRPTECFVANDLIVHNTWTLVQLAHHAWKVQNKRVLFVTTEMSKVKIFQRWASLNWKMPYNDLRKAQLPAFQEEAMRKGIMELKGAEGLSIVGGTFNFTFDALEAAIDECKPELVLIDGLYLMRSGGEGRTEKAANTFDATKILAKRMQLPFVTSTQFNRDVKQNNAGSMSVEKIALSDAAGWNADLVYGLAQTEDMKRDKRMIIKPLKFREGTGEDIECWWDFDRMVFDEVGGPLANPHQAALRGAPGGGYGPGGVPISPPPPPPSYGPLKVVPPPPDDDEFSTGVLDFRKDFEDDDVPF